MVLRKLFLISPYFVFNALFLLMSVIDVYVCGRDISMFKLTSFLSGLLPESSKILTFKIIFKLLFKL